MEFERTTMAQFSEIKRLIGLGQSNREIARVLNCRRLLVAGIRKGEVGPEQFDRTKREEKKLPPAWALDVDWGAVERDIVGGFQIKRIWEEVAGTKTSHSNFFKHVKARFANLLEATITLREFNPGSHLEVDYAGSKIEWIDGRTGEIHQAHVFIGILCYSQKIFAIAHENEQKQNWLDAHRRMFEYYGGVPRVVVPDQLKNGVLKSHRYDPNLNPDYVELAAHYGVAILPARVRRPRDKALVENAVGILMRYFQFIYRRRTFMSLEEINEALRQVVAKLNAKIHSRFKVSRDARYEAEKPALRPLPLEPYNLGQWKIAKLHPDCTVAVDGNYYSAPHIHRGKELRVKTTAISVEIFLDLDRVALHERARGKIGERIVKNEHLPENSRAYLETTPQRILSQARFSHPDLHRLIHELFVEDSLIHLRRAQGLVRKAYSTIQSLGRDKATPIIAGAVAHMKRFNRIRVRAFEEFIEAELKKGSKVPGPDRTIVRRPGNPMVRGHGTRLPEGSEKSVPHQQLRLV